MPLKPSVFARLSQVATPFFASGLMLLLPVSGFSQSASAPTTAQQKSSQQKAAQSKVAQQKAAQQKAAQQKAAQQPASQKKASTQTAQKKPASRASASTATPKSASSQKAANKQKQAKNTKRQETARTVANQKARAKKAESNYVSVGSRLGLRSQEAELVLNSSAVLVIDQRTNEVLLEKNPDVALPIASITKLMTALVTLEAGLPMDEEITITQDDARLEKYSASRLKVGSQFSRGELLHLALMSSENRAAQALGRTYPGGLSAFVDQMNSTAQALGMTRSQFVEPTGLSSQNVATPRDLTSLVNAAYQFPLIRQYSTDRGAVVSVGGRQQQFVNTNSLARGEIWDIGVSKTGFIRDAGRCLVMQTTIQNNPVIMVMLDAQATGKRVADAERIRRWLSTQENYAGFRS